MSTHIGAKNGDIAEAVLLPGDPLRAKFIAENSENRFVTTKSAACGFTGTYKGKSIRSGDRHGPALAFHICK